MSTVFKSKTGKTLARHFIGIGHGGSDPGASKYVVEKTAALNMALAEKDYLVAHGVEVCMSRVRDENDPVEEEVRECNKYNPDATNEVHLNSGGGDGFEVYRSVIGTDSKKLAECIEKQVKAIGQNSRGVKTKTLANGQDYFMYVRETYAPAALCEGGFVDNKNDAKDFDELNEQRAFGIAYAKGVLDYYGIKYDDDDAAEQTKPSGGSSGNKKPAVKKAPDVKYQTYTRGKGLLPNVINCSGKGTDAYAGWIDYDILALFANTVGKEEVAGKLKFRAHDREKGVWLNWQYDREKDANGENFAGTKKTAIDGLQMELEGLEGFEVWYQAYTAEDGWLEPVTGWGAGYNGYAGIYGHDIQAVKIKVVKAA